MTPFKHQLQRSPFRHLLKPKAGGVAFVLEAMGDALHTIIDVTIAYPHGKPTFADLFANRIHEVRVTVRERQIPALAGPVGDAARLQESCPVPPSTATGRRRRATRNRG